MLQIVNTCYTRHRQHARRRRVPALACTDFRAALSHAAAARCGSYQCRGIRGCVYVVAENIYELIDISRGATLYFNPLFLALSAGRGDR